MVNRGTAYFANLGEAKRGHEQRGRRPVIVVSPSQMRWSVVTVVPTSMSAQPAIFRPLVELDGVKTRALVDQIRTIDTQYLGDYIATLDRVDLAELDLALTQYLGLVSFPE